MDYKLYRVRWIDSTSSYGWVTRKDVRQEDLGVVSVGFLVAEYSDQVVLSAHIAPGCIDAPMHIPKTAITSMEEIKDGEAQCCKAQKNS